MSTFNFFKRFVIFRLPVFPKFKSRVPKFPRALYLTSVAFTVKAFSQPVDKESVTASLSSKTLLQRVSSVTVTSTSQILILSAALLIEYHETYRSTVENVLGLMQEMLTFINSEPHQEKLWNEMVAARAAIDESKKTLIEMQSFMEYVEKLVTAVAETAYFAGSEFASTSICELFSSTQQKLEMENNKTKELELEYQRQQKSFVETMSEKGKIPCLEEGSI